MASDKQKAAPNGEAVNDDEKIIPEAETADATAAAAEGLVDLTDLDSAAELSPDEDPIALLEAEIASLKDQLLRAVAETENIRSRGRREREEGVKYAAVPLIQDLLAVADNLQRAIAAVPADAVEEDPQLKNLLAGVQMTEKELLSVFERHKIQVINPQGEKFDPHWHQAMLEVPDPSQPAGTIMQVMQPGFRLHDRLLRAAMVSVAKGGPAAAPDPAEAPADEEA